MCLSNVVGETKNERMDIDFWSNCSHTDSSGNTLDTGFVEKEKGGELASRECIDCHSKKILALRLKSNGELTLMVNFSVEIKFFLFYGL